jgi:TonB-dependent SusC/RagA subfamily outer membrane receptor
MKKSLLMAFAMFGLLFSAIAQSTVTGTVKDDTGESLPGATVTIKGTTTGTTTDLDGKYSLKVPSAESVLVFSFAGMNPQEETVGNRSVIDVTLNSNTVLKELIVTGYGDLDEEKFTGSVANVGSKAIESVPIPSFDQILQGRAPGLLVRSGSGQPGTAANVTIRGQGSISSGNEPLYVVDGVPVEGGSFATLNPNDFASVAVLKDASSAALYGSRGANGVIVVTTKRGKAGQLSVNYKYQAGWSQQAREKFEMMNSREKLDFEI